MEKRETKKIVDSLLDLPEFEPERVKVKVTRLNMVFELQELPYDKLGRRTPTFTLFSPVPATTRR